MIKLRVEHEQGVLGRVNFKLVSFITQPFKCLVYKQPLLELKTQTRLKYSSHNYVSNSVQRPKLLVVELNLGPML
jgi:hypothetical protein